MQPLTVELDCGGPVKYEQINHIIRRCGANSANQIADLAEPLARPHFRKIKAN